MLYLRFGFLWLVLAVVCSSEAASPLEYNRDVRPILAEHCFACHGPDSASRKGDLRLDVRESAIGSSAIDPGNTDTSSLITRIQTTSPEEVMPPPETKKTLSAEQKEVLRVWIESGAEYQAHWSWIPPVKPPLPVVKNASWPKNPIDTFIVSRLETLGLEPAPAADGRTLFRRLHLDITGLPPKPADTEAFNSQYGVTPDLAVSEWIERLMSQPTWGEHRARYWLDAARYADTHGLHFDNYREIWPYRDWVIRSFNANQPFDQFTMEQLAGDLLPNPTIDQLIATGFQRCNMTTNEGGTIDEENLAIYASDRVQTFGWVYLGLTTNCAQCHDHKFDPITMKDYYSLAAYFRNTTQPAKDGNVKNGNGPVVTVVNDKDRPRWDALPGEISTAVAQRDARRENARSDFDAWIATLTQQRLTELEPRQSIALHLPLSEQPSAATEQQTAPELASEAPTATEAICHAIDTTNQRTYTSTGPIQRIPGKLGPAPVIKSGSTFDLGDQGNYSINQAFSVGAWIRVANDQATAGMIARMDDSDNHRGWDLWQQGASVAVHVIDQWPSNAMKVVSEKGVLKPGEWQHVFATYDGSAKPEGIKIYIDGKATTVRFEQTGLKSDGNIRTSTPLRLGQRSQGAVFEGGGIQDVRLYDRQLDATEVHRLAQWGRLTGFVSLMPEQRTDEIRRPVYEDYLAFQDTMYPALAKTVTTLEQERDAISSRSPVTHIQTERTDSPPMANVLMRGEYDQLGEQVGAMTPVSLHPLPPGAPSNRLGLAQWILDSNNPLTARVTVNRFWQEVFGRGIVTTPEDFGISGMLPSHPELLDWLAIEFREQGWNVKHIFKTMLSSATYRQAAITTPEKLERDRDNQYLSRGPRFRMDAEMIRDYALSASGLLTPELFGKPVKPYQPENIWDVVGLPGGDTRNYVTDQGPLLYRRTVYTFWKRMAPPPNLDAFNAPSREVCSVRRERTNTPLQALVTLNDPQFVEAARRLAEQTLRNAKLDTDDRIRFISQQLLARDLTLDELIITRQSLTDLAQYYTHNPEQAKELIVVGASAADVQLSPSELAAWTMLVNQLMNLDEVLCK